MPPSPNPETIEIARARLVPRKRTTTINSTEVSAVYRIEGLRPSEFPVVGVFVSPRIVPGFCYK